jgi:hypothetical protein
MFPKAAAEKCGYLYLVCRFILILTPTALHSRTFTNCPWFPRITFSKLKEKAYEEFFWRRSYFQEEKHKTSVTISVYFRSFLLNFAIKISHSAL